MSEEAGAPALSVVIPAYNEERRLPATLEGWLGYLAGRPGGAEIVVADDGSRDGTARVVEAAAGGPVAVRLVRLAENQGKGGAVREGMLAARGALRFQVDADLNIAPGHVDGAVDRLRAGADLVVGRRSLSEYASEERSITRLAAGAAVQLTRRLIVMPRISDTQAGFKGYRAGLAEEVFRRALIRSFAFDIEAIFIARRLGARIVEMPVRVEYRADSTYDVRRDLPPFLRDIVRIRLNAVRGRYRLPRARPRPGRPGRRRSGT